MPSASAASMASSKSTGWIAAPRDNDGPPPSLTSPPFCFEVVGWSVVWVTSTAIAAAGARACPVVWAPRKEVSSDTLATPVSLATPGSAA